MNRRGLFIHLGLDWPKWSGGTLAQRVATSNRCQLVHCSPFFQPKNVNPHTEKSNKTTPNGWADSPSGKKHTAGQQSHRWAPNSCPPLTSAHQQQHHHSPGSLGQTNGLLYVIEWSPLVLTISCNTTSLLLLLLLIP